MRKFVTVLSMTTALGSLGCYDSRWGEQKRLQRQRAAQSTPTLGVDDTASENGKPSSKPARVLRLRAYATRAYRTQVVDLNRAIRDLLEDANAVTEPALGARLELEGIRSWDVTSDDDLGKLLAELRAADEGKDVDRVVGLVGGLSRLTESFHDLGMANIPGRHIVLRAHTDARQHDSIERSYSELSDDERHRMQRAHRRHRSAAVFLHEIGHTLGSPHERSDRSIMYPRYRPEMSSFGPVATLAMRTVLDHHDRSSSGNELGLYQDLSSTLRQAPEGAFFEEDRRHVLDELDRVVASLSRPPAAAAAAAPVERRVADVPEISAEDRITFAHAQDLNDKGDRVAAWESGKPLFDRYPEVLAVQDLRCNVAMRVFPFEQARRECERLMKLARQPH